MPAVKNKVVAGPDPFLGGLGSESPPKAIIHRPSMTMTESSGFLTKLMNLPVKPLKAAILPLPKLPTRMELLYSPKSRGVHTTPQGEFIHGPCWRWPISLPDGVKKRTKPKPSPATSSCLAESCLA